MEKGRMSLLIARALQLICAVVALAVSAKLYGWVDEWLDACHQVAKDKYCKVGRVPSSLGFASFTGAFGALDALVGIIAVFFTAMPYTALLVFDALAAVFFLVGGINSALLRTGDASGMSGSIKTRFDTSTAFMFLAFLSTLAAITLVFFSRRSSNKHSAV